MGEAFFIHIHISNFFFWSVANVREGAVRVCVYLVFLAARFCYFKFFFILSFLFFLSFLCACPSPFCLPRSTETFAHVFRASAAPMIMEGGMTVFPDNCRSIPKKLFLIYTFLSESHSRGAIEIL